MPANRYDSQRLAKTAAGSGGPQLCITVIPANNGTAPATLSPGGFWPRATRRDAIVSVIEFETAGGSALVDRTKTAAIAAGGSLTPGVVLDGPAIVTWFKFDV